ncbi:MAG: CHAD domain-containing protein [Bacteroidales bacterium]
MDKFLIKPENDIKKEVIRIILSQVVSIHEMTCDRSNGINENVHEMRKRFKMIRSVIRLIRDSAGYSVYYRENIRFRDLSRKLSSARDSEVLLQNAIKIGEKIPQFINDNKYKAILFNLTQKRDRALYKILKEEKVCDQIRNTLEEAIPVIHDINIKKTGFDVIEKGMKRMYRQAKKYLNTVIENNEDPVAIHTLRKRVKYLWYQIQMLEPVFPEQINAIAVSLDQIADELGIHRDNYLFQLSLQKNDFFQLNKTHRSEIMKITNKEKKLQAAIEAAQKFYSEKPKDFTGRIRNWYNLSQQTQ